MIKSFKNKALEKLFKDNSNQRIPSELAKRVRIRLEVIDSALTLEEMRLPSYNLHELKGNRQGTFSIRLSGNWRITFTFEEGNAYNVELEDYH